MNKKLYAVNGQLNKNFVGHITYTTVLPENIDNLKISFRFDKREPFQEEELKNGVRQTLENESVLVENLDEIVNYFAKHAKTEINVQVFIDDFCIGAAHRDEVEKTIVIGKSNSSLGFVNCKLSGVIKIVLNVLCVLNDETNYTLCLENYAVGGTQHEV